MSLFCCSCCDKTQKFRRKKGFRRKSLFELLCCIRSQTGGIGAFSFRNNVNFSDINIERDPNLRYSERPVTIQWNTPQSDVEQPLLPVEEKDIRDPQDIREIQSEEENSNENESDAYPKSKKSKKSSFISYIRSNRSYNRTKIRSKDYF